MTFWKTFWACFLAIILSSVASMIISTIVFISIISSLILSTSEVVEVKDKSVLCIDLNTPIVDVVDSDMSKYIDFNTFEINMPMTLYAMNQTIEKAAIDPSIKGIYIKIPMAQTISSTNMYELRCAIETFKKQAPQKFVMSYSDAYSQDAIYLASVSNKVFLNPAGAVNWVGMAATPIFFKGTLEKLGIEPEVIRHGKFKGAVEPYILDKLSAENREQYQCLIDSNWDFLVKSVAEARGLKADDLQKAASDLSVQNAKDAKELGLVDELFYNDQVKDWMESQVDDYKIISAMDYNNATSLTMPLSFSKNKIEVIYAEGEITDSGDPTQIIGNILAERIEDARTNDNVKAIVLRVNSPGGSALASEVIGREVMLAAEAKPVIISMGEYAASGGYWISAPATKIVAAPNTLTGSIGVFGVLFNAQKGAKDILGLTADVVKTNPSADLGSILRPITPVERQVIQNSIEEVYQGFLEQVSKGRNMTTQKVDEIGQGRIWSGTIASEIGLVDNLGTLSDAIAIAAKEAKIEGNYTVKENTGYEDNFFNILMKSSGGVLCKFFPTIFSSSLEEIVTGEIKAQNKKAQARLPYNLEFLN